MPIKNSDYFDPRPRMMDVDYLYGAYLLAVASAGCGAAPPIGCMRSREDFSPDVVDELAAQALGARDGLALRGNVPGARVLTRAQFTAELVEIVGQPS